VFEWHARNEFYKGEYKQDMMHGRGRMQYQDGSYYVGNFLFNQPEGLGKMQWADGAFFVGHWRRGLREGPGLVFNGKERVRGVWAKDKRVDEQLKDF
jgi:hypothetical protein